MLFLGKQLCFEKWFQAVQNNLKDPNLDRDLLLQTLEAGIEVEKIKVSLHYQFSIEISHNLKENCFTPTLILSSPNEQYLLLAICSELHLIDNQAKILLQLKKQYSGFNFFSFSQDSSYFAAIVKKKKSILSNLVLFDLISRRVKLKLKLEAILDRKFFPGFQFIKDNIFITLKKGISIITFEGKIVETPFNNGQFKVQKIIENYLLLQNYNEQNLLNSLQFMIICPKRYKIVKYFTHLQKKDEYVAKPLEVTALQKLLIIIQPNLYFRELIRGKLLRKRQEILIEKDGLVSPMQFFLINQILYSFDQYFFYRVNFYTGQTFLQSLKLPFKLTEWNLNPILNKAPYLVEIQKNEKYSLDTMKALLKIHKVVI